LVQYDVVVSGAGPAGSQAAYRCALAGLRTVLLERDALPRPKCCAGGVLARAQARAGLQLPPDLVEQEVRRFAVVWDGRRKEFPLSTEVARIVRRDRLDDFLAKRAEGAGAEVRERTKSLRAKETDQDVTVVTDRGEISAKALIVAEGCTSRLASSLYGPYPGRKMAMGMAVDCEFDTGPGDVMEVHFIDTPTDRLSAKLAFPLNGWMFPHRHGGNVGVVGQAATADQLRGTVEKVMKNCEDSYGGVVSRSTLTAHPLPLYPRRRLHTRRTLLVGDAAGFVNPITGEGMSYAFSSANLAAGSVERLLNGGAGLGSYARGCRGEILNDLSAASFFGSNLHWLLGKVDLPGFFDQVERNRGVMDACAGIARGEDNWRSLLMKMVPQILPLLLLHNRVIRGRA
jgi:geranylgeranyl reductase family protein